MKEKLEKAGINYDDAMTRVMNNETLYIHLLKKLPATIEAGNVMEHIDSGDLQSAVSQAHSIKGATGNLAVIPLYEAYSEATQLLREGKPEEARSVLTDIAPKQKELIDFINKL